MNLLAYLSECLLSHGYPRFAEANLPRREKELLIFCYSLICLVECTACLPEMYRLQPWGHTAHWYIIIAVSPMPSASPSNSGNSEMLRHMLTNKPPARQRSNSSTSSKKGRSSPRSKSPPSAELQVCVRSCLSVNQPECRVNDHKMKLV